MTVTLTEGPASPQHSSALSAASPLSSQSSTAVAERDDEGSPMEAMEKGQENGALPEPEEPEPKAGSPKSVLPSPTKETCPELSLSLCPSPSPAAQPEPMDASPSAPEAPVEEDVLAPEREPQRDEEQDEVTSEPALPEEGGVLPPAESSPTLEMDTTPASELSFSGFSSPAAEEKGLSSKPSPGFSPDGSGKLSQSPFSTEASPRETTHTGSQHSYSASVPHSAFYPLTPKIGMGKPAISKRKFSPGRPRAKQVRGHSHSRPTRSSPHAVTLMCVMMLPVHPQGSGNSRVSVESDG